MKKLVITLIILMVSMPAFSFIHESQTDPDPIKRKAALILMINKSLSDIQAKILRDSLMDLTVEDLEYISGGARNVNEVIRGLEERAPDDEDEHAADAKN